MASSNTETAGRGVSVSKRDANKTLQLLKKHNLVNPELQPSVDKGRIVVPLIVGADRAILTGILFDVPDFKLIWWTFAARKKREDIRTILTGKMPESILSKIPPPMDTVGDVVIVEISDELHPFRGEIANAIIQVNKRARSVLRKSGPVSGDFRVRELEHLAGDTRTETVHREFGLRFLLNPRRVYFSPRLANEHARIAGLVHEGELVVDMFAGVGPFAIAIASKTSSTKVVAIDQNPSAVEYLNRNIALNKVAGRVESRLGDAREIIESELRGRADRVVMNLPERSEEFLPAAISSLKTEGGIVHFYCFARSENPEAYAANKLQTSLEKIHESPEADRVLRVRETAPYEWQMVVDARIKPRHR